MAPTQRDRFDLDFAEIHQTVRPADVRSHDRVVARIRHRGATSNFFQIRVWKLSPLGIELVFDKDYPLKKGDQIDLEIVVGGQRTFFEGLVVDLVQESDELKLLGIKLSVPNRNDTADGEKRKSIRWVCSEEFFPTCVSPTPGRFNEYIYFQIRDISKTGFQLQCSLRNKYLIPGTLLNLTASFPMVGDISLGVTITRVGVTSERGKDYLVVGTTFTTLSQNARNIIGQYLLQFSDAESLSDLRNAGMIPTSMSKGTDFYFLKSEDDYQRVLELRLAAHKTGGTVEGDFGATDMGDIYDINSRIIVGKFKGEVIATARIHFNVLDEPMEHEKYVEWPAQLPRRDQTLEISRVCTHPEFRGSDLLAALLRFISTTCFQPQRPWVVISSTDALVSFYGKVGLEKTGLVYKHPVFQGNQNILLGNAYGMLLARSPHPMYWNVIWKDAYNYLIETGILTQEPMDRARIRAYKALYPVASLWFRLTSQKRGK